MVNVTAWSRAARVVATVGVTAALAVASGGTVAATPASDGSEPSVEAVKGRLDCGAGYEFWLARQALARNPAIKLYGLQWSAPAWVRDRNGGLWSRAAVPRAAEVPDVAATSAMPR